MIFLLGLFIAICAALGLVLGEYFILFAVGFAILIEIYLDHNESNE